MSAVQSSNIELLPPFARCYEKLNDSCPRNLQSVGIQFGVYLACSTGMFLAVMGNLVVVISISHFKILHTPASFLLLSLAAAELLLGLTVLPFSTIRSGVGCWYFGNSFCRLHTLMDTGLCLVSVLHLCFISIDRYCAICYPLRYHAMFTIRVVCTYIGVGWCVPAAYVSFFLYTNVIEEVFSHLVVNRPCVGHCEPLFNKAWGWVNFPMFFFPCFLMISLYVKIVIVANRQARQISAIHNRIGSSGPIGASKREWKAAKTLGIAVAVYLLCWLPFAIYTMVDSLLDFENPAILLDMLNWCTYFNSACNPLIYVFSYHWFRKALKMIVTCNIFDPGSSAVDLYQE